MPTSSELVKQKNADAEWDAFMAQLRATEAAKSAQPAPEPEPPATPDEKPQPEAAE